MAAYDAAAVMMKQVGGDLERCPNLYDTAANVHGEMMKKIVAKEYLVIECCCDKKKMPISPTPAGPTAWARAAWASTPTFNIAF